MEPIDLDLEDHSPKAATPTHRASLTQHSQGNGHVASQQSASDAALTPSPGPRLCDDFFGFDFGDADLKKNQQMQNQADRTKEVLHAAQKTMNIKDLYKVLYPKNLFVGLGDTKLAPKTIQGWLEDALSNSRELNHRELAAAAQHFDMRMTAPLPWILAIDSIATHDGICPESLSLALDANIGWLEHHATRLRHCSTSTHRGVSPAPAVMLGSAVSAKKSHIIEFTDAFLEKAEPLDDEGKPGYIAARKIVISDATLAGIRKSFRKYNRAIVTSAEAANTYECHFSTKRPGLHFLPEQVMNKFTQSEPDDSVTAGSEAHLGSDNMPYLLLHKVSGQQDRFRFKGFLQTEPQK